ncbi:uncharacterized protein [Clytia hemisphaerica]|uniref:Cnidarian restricted protein n=1 Tax=Clytia hemisphaerica TaxID=252671 RepID=A0A7M5XCX1_9CNID
MIRQRLTSILIIITNYYFSTSQAITSPTTTLFESFNNKDGENCTKVEPGFKTLSLVECLLHCKLEKGGKDALMENNGTICFCAQCEMSKDTKTNSTVTYYKELKVSGPKAVTKQPICYRAKGNGYATFRMPDKGAVQSVTLIHVSGKLQCFRTQSTNWGCDSTTASGPHDILVSVTDDQDTVIFPDRAVGVSGFIMIPGVDLNSQELTLESSSPYVIQEANQEMRVWNNQDLIDTSESNNSGEQCVHVVVNYL